MFPQCSKFSQNDFNYFLSRYVRCRLYTSRMPVGAYLGRYNKYLYLVLKPLNEKGSKINFKKILCSHLAYVESSMAFISDNF